MVVTAMSPESLETALHFVKHAGVSLAWPADQDECHQDECRVCAGAHDAELHAAVSGVRAWLRDRLELAVRPIKAGKQCGKFGSGALIPPTDEKRRMLEKTNVPPTNPKSR